jgi:hypothetical protein
MGQHKYLNRFFSLKESYIKASLASLLSLNDEIKTKRIKPRTLDFLYYEAFLA